MYKYIDMNIPPVPAMRPMARDRWSPFSSLTSVTWNDSMYIPCGGRERFLVSGFEFRVSGVGFWVSDVGFRVSGLGFRISGFGIRDPESGFQV